MTSSRGKKNQLDRRAQGWRLIRSLLRPSAWLHQLKLVNYYYYSHVEPLAKIQRGKDLRISPDAVFSNPERIVLGSRVHIGSRCHIWAGHASSTIRIGDDCLFGPEVMVTAATYRFNDGHPVTQQDMDEADIVIGRDVWFGTRAIVLPGSTIGDGAIIGAGTIVKGHIPPMAIAVGQPARIVGTRAVTGDGQDPLPTDS